MEVLPTVCVRPFTASTTLECNGYLHYLVINFSIEKFFFM